MIGRARQDWSPPGWLDLRLAVLESRAHVLAGDITAAVAAAERADPQSVPEAAAALAHAWLATGDHETARRSLDAVTAGRSGAPDGIGLAGWLVDAQLSYSTGDRERGRRSLQRALLLAGPERLKLPFAMEQAWLRQVLRHDPELAQSAREMLEPAARPAAVPGQRRPPTGQQAPLVVEPLSEREREVLLLLAGMLSTAEIAAEMYLSVNTVKTHLRSIYRKLSAAHRGEAVRRARQLQLI